MTGIQRRAQSKRPDPPFRDDGPGLATTHRCKARHDRNDSYQKTDRLAAWFGAVWRAGLERASMATYEYRVTEAADGTFPVELWSSQGDRSQLIYKTRGFQTRELAEAWIVPVEDRSGDPPSPRSRVIYLKPRSSTFNP